MPEIIFLQNKSHHPDMKNIHGYFGCETGSGNICTACCWLYRIPGLKSDQEYCEHQCLKEGCKIHNDPEQPDRCKTFHCSRLLVDIANPRLEMEKRLISYAQAQMLVAQANLQEEITSDEADTSSRALGNFAISVGLRDLNIFG